MVGEQLRRIVAFELADVLFGGISVLETIENLCFLTQMKCTLMF